MRIKRELFRTANRLLGHLDLALAVTQQDFDARLESGKYLNAVFLRLAVPINDWLAEQRLFHVNEPKINVTQEIERFYGEYLKLPFRSQMFGSRFNNLLWLSLIARAMRPTIIIDSGTYTGASAWALSVGAPSSPVFSFDIDLSRLSQRTHGVDYIEADWTAFDLSGHDLSRGLCYFDDHVDQVRRLLEAHARGFDLAIFDDDFPITSFAAMAHGGAALPKIEFLLDSSLSDGEVISWSDRGTRHHFEISREYLDKGKAVIDSTDRLPNTSLITGIHQTPYRVVALKRYGAQVGA